MTPCDCTPEGENWGIERDRSGVAVDQALSLLAHERRRKVLKHLHHSTEASTTLESLLDKLEDGSAPVHEKRIESKERTRNELYHQHLPKLEEVEVIEFDRQSETIRYDPDPVVGELLTVIEKLED